MTTFRTEVAAKEIVAGVLRNGGSTQSAVVGVLEPTSGYAVSLKGYEEIHRIDPLTASESELVATVSDYIECNLGQLGSPGNFVGAWLEGDTLYLDVTRVVPERANAEKLATDGDQLAIFDLTNGVELIRVTRLTGPDIYVTQDQLDAAFTVVGELQV